MSVFVKSNIYNISSKNADVIFNNSALSSGLWSLPNLNFNDGNIKAVYFSIQHAEIANTFYIINGNNNILIMNDALNGTFSTTIPVGNYNVTNFISTVTPLLPSGYSITYDSKTCKLTFTNTSRDFSIIGGTTCYSIIGSGLSTIASTARSLVLPNCVNFLPTARLNIRSNSFNLGNFGIDGATDILLTIQNNGGQTARVLYQNYNNLRFLVEQNNLQQIDLRITIDDGSLCDFNGVDWYMTFQIDIEYFDRPKLKDFKSIIYSA